MEVNIDKNFSDLKYLKEPAKKTSLNNMKDLIAKLKWLESLGDFEYLIKDVSYSKLKHFSNEVESLDASEIKKGAVPKRYTIIISFLHITKARLRDNLTVMFLKCVNGTNNRGKEELKSVNEKLRSKTETIVSAFTEILDAAKIKSDKEFGKKIRTLINNYGGHELLYTDCTSINSYNNNNYYVFYINSFQNKGLIYLNSLIYLNLHQQPKTNR